LEKQARLELLSRKELSELVNMKTYENLFRDSKEYKTPPLSAKQRRMYLEMFLNEGHHVYGGTLDSAYDDSYIFNCLLFRCKPDGSLTISGVSKGYNYAKEMKTHDLVKMFIWKLSIDGEYI